MPYCRKLKHCDLCGRRGHNPYKCWMYSTMESWARRAKKLNRCIQCLTLCTTEDNCLDKDGDPKYCCPHCYAPRTYWNPEYGYVLRENCKESQTEENSFIGQECQEELQKGKDIIEEQRLQIEELNSRISTLEVKLKSSIATIKELNSQLQYTVQEKEQELRKAGELDLLCKEKEAELRKFCELIGQKDFELDQYRKASAQSSQPAPATTQQPYPPSVSNNSGYIKETTCIKPTLENLQDQQQKLFLIVNQLFNRIMTQDTSWYNYPSFNPYMGPYDTGQYFNKLQQV